MKDSWQEFEGVLGYEFGNRELLREALTHRSFVAEYNSSVPHNQRLEFLGDAVIQIAVTARLYEDFPEHDEGYLTKLRATLTRGETLAGFARHLKLGDYLRLGRGEARNEGSERDSNLGDAFEAVVGAIFLDSGKELQHVTALLDRLVTQLHPDIEDNLEGDNPKGTLQEWAQLKLRERPVYETLESSGPDHAKTFKVAVHIRGECYGTGVAGRLRNAEQEAARQALSKIEPGREVDEGKSESDSEP